MVILAVGIGYYFGYDIGWEKAIDENGTELTECRPTGCSNHICSDEDVITTCEYLPEYACYQNARCERQKNGECGWTPTEELNACIAEYK